MKKMLLFIALAFAIPASAQSSFKAGWNTYTAGTVTHEYNYTCLPNDSLKLIDSSLILISTDSLVTLRVNFPEHDKILRKTIHYFNTKKQIIKTEEYKGDNLLMLKEWKYDDKDRKAFFSEDNKLTGKNFRKNYTYAPDKKSGELVVTESSYFNGRIEFYTRSYYDRKGVLYKEVRLNDNNKDVVHIESFTYGENGKVKERTVYFPEWRVTKKFQEREGEQLPKCFKTFPIAATDRISVATRNEVIKKLLLKNKPILSDKDCEDFEYKFSNKTSCEVVVCSTKLNKNKQIIFRYKEKA